MQRCAKVAKRGLHNKKGVANDMITIKEYAAQKGVSHQAVYKQLQTHAEELEPFIVTNGRTRLLTDEAIAILETHRDTNPQIIERTNDKEHIAYLEDQIKALLVEENKQEKEKAELSKELKEAYKKMADEARLIASAEANKLLLEDKEKQLQQEIEKNAAVVEENAILKAEIERLKHRSLLERLFNKYD